MQQLDLMASAIKVESMALSACAGMLVAITFTPTEVTTLVGAITALIGVIFAGMAQLRATARKLDEVKKATTETKAATEAVAKKTDVIEGHVNSAATKSEAIIKSLEIQLAMLKETVIAQDKQAALLASAQAIVNAVQAVNTVPPIPVAPSVAATAQTAAADEETLKSIDVNTSETAKNTARTEADVQELKDRPSKP